MTKVIKNFLPLASFKLLKTYYESSGVNWNFCLSTLEDKSDKNFLFFNIVSDKEIKENPNWKTLLELLEKHIGKFKLSRVKINLYPNQNKPIQHAFHVDVIDKDENVIKKMVTCILNLTTCNGYTIVGDTKIPSVENELIIFDTDTLHCGGVQTDTQTRIIMNINLILENKGLYN